MKIIHSILAFLLCLVLVKCSVKKTNEFTLKGKIIGQDNGKIILNYVPDYKPVLDTVTISNGEFVFHGQIKEPLFCALYMDRNLNRTSLFIEPGIMEVSVTKDNFKDFKMTGSKSQDEVFLLRSLLKTYEIKREALDLEWGKISDSIKKSEDAIKKSNWNNQLNILKRKISDENAKIDSIHLKYLFDNPKSFVSAYYLYSIILGNDKITLDSLKWVFSKLDTIVQKGTYGERIHDDIRKRENVLIGVVAPDFKTTDINNQVVTLSQFRISNIVLLDFWASWCIPCRKNTPHLKTIYNQYHTKGLEIIAVSIDTDKQVWVTAVKEDGTNIWYNIRDGYNIFRPQDLTNQDVYFHYFYNSIPVQILIDFDGKVIGHWIGSSPENNEALDKLIAYKLSEKNKKRTAIIDQKGK
jgi:peroxiredoxin